MTFSADDADQATPSAVLDWRFPWWGWAFYAVSLAAVAGVGASSFWMEAERTGSEASLWRLVVTELTSVAVLLALTPALVSWTRRLDPGRVGWPLTLAGHVAGFAVFLVLHIAGMLAMRFLIFRDGLDPLGSVLLYEGRKDAITYVVLAGGAWLLAYVLGKRRPAVSDPPSRPRLEIRDGARRSWLDIADILWVEAAGNYVELHLRDRSILSRQTLAHAERQLAAHGFVRLHRSRLVNTRHIVSATTNDSGDFSIQLDDGRELSGSRRWRSAIDAVSAGR